MRVFVIFTVLMPLLFACIVKADKDFFRSPASALGHVMICAMVAIVVEIAIRILMWVSP